MKCKLTKCIREPGFHGGRGGRRPGKRIDGRKEPPSMAGEAAVGKGDQFTHAARARDEGFRTDIVRTGKLPCDEVNFGYGRRGRCAGGRRAARLQRGPLAGELIACSS